MGASQGHQAAAGGGAASGSRPAAAPTLTSVAAFAGAGGIEKGFAGAGIHASDLIENWEPARKVLRHYFPDAVLHGDITEVTSLPTADVLTGGFPCTDFSQAGSTAGIDGANSGLVRELFRLLPTVDPTWFVVENVKNMLSLDKGRAMDVLVEQLELLGYAWAYRVVNSQAFGVPQRRLRVFLVASRSEDPRDVLFADDAGDRRAGTYRDDAYGFYTTEGNRGVGWARDAVPTLKGSSTIGIPSPPGIWVPGAAPGHKIVKPRIEDAEAMQGFRRGWTRHAEGTRRGHGDRWRLVGNAVTVSASRWLGRRLVAPGTHDPSVLSELAPDAGWPAAACGSGGRRFRAHVTTYPVRYDYQHLLDVIDPAACGPVSLKAAAGFLHRLERSTLTRDPDFLLDLKEHVALLEAAPGR